MALKSSLTAFLVGIVLLVAAPAFAHGVSTVTVDAASYLPGSTVNVNGQFLDGDLAVPAGVVSVTLGSGGPVVGQAQPDTSGAWALSFALPTAMELGAYVLQAMVPVGGGVLVAQIALVVGAAPAVETLTPATVPAPDPDSLALGDIVVPAAAATAAPEPPVKTRPQSSPASRPVARPAALVATPAAITPRRSAAPPVRRARSSSLHMPAAARPSLTRPAARPALAPASPRPTDVSARDRRRAQAAPSPLVIASPNSATPTRPNVAIETVPANPTVPSPASAGRRKWLLTAALSLLLLLFGGTAASAVARRRFPRGPLDPIEVELQQLIAEERARQALEDMATSPAEPSTSDESYLVGRDAADGSLSVTNSP